jgi:hypothetical protein
MRVKEMDESWFNQLSTEKTSIDSLIYTDDHFPPMGAVPVRPHKGKWVEWLQYEVRW